MISIYFCYRKYVEEMNTALHIFTPVLGKLRLIGPSNCFGTVKTTYTFTVDEHSPYFN